MRNKSLDAVKAIAACLVVCIHVSFPGPAYHEAFCSFSCVLFYLGMFYESLEWGESMDMDKRACEYRVSEGIFRVQQYFSGKSTFMVSSCINLLLSACSPD